MNQIKAEVLARSINPQGDELITYLLVYPRFIHCFDEKTKILSQINNEHPEFRSFQAVESLKCKVAQYKDNIISFVYPENFIKNTGLQNMVNFNKKKLSMNVTNEHRVHTLKRTTNNLFVEDVIKAKDLLQNYGTRRILQAGFMLQEQIYSTEELELIAWYVADGHNEGKTSNFHIRKERKKEAIIFLLNKLNIKYTLHTYTNELYGNEYIIRFDNPCWVEDCYENNTKKLPDSACFMSNEAYIKFKNALLNSDGNIKNNEYNTTSKILAYQIQVIALLHGDAMNIREYSGLYKQKFKNKNYISIRADKDIFNTKIVNTTTYCVTVPSSFVVVQRMGVAYISGNCELMTHRMFSRNSASSRAIPFERMVKMVEEDPFIPIAVQRDHKGMQGTQYLDETQYDCFKMEWLAARDSAIKHAKWLNTESFTTKQLCNRLLEPFMWHTVLVTTSVTEESLLNFFELRNPKYDTINGIFKSKRDALLAADVDENSPNFYIDEDDWRNCNSSQAEIHIQALAEAMWDARNMSTLKQLKSGEWHIPFGDKIEYYVGSKGYDIMCDRHWTGYDLSTRIATARCARLSYNNHDGKIDYQKDIELHDRLLRDHHMSPFEHCARAMHNEEYYSLIKGKYPTTKDEWGIVNYERYPYIFKAMFEDEPVGINPNNPNIYGWCNNFKGFIPYRYLIENNYEV